MTPPTKVREDPKDPSRRRFLKWAALAGVGAIAVVAGVATFFGSTNRSFTPVHPTGGRVVRIRTLDTNSVWDPTSYTAQGVLAMIDDLKPTTLNRYTSGIQRPDALVPVDPGQPDLTVQQFLQDSLDAAATNAVIFPRVSLKEYLSGTILNTCQELFSLYDSLVPPMSLISFDNWESVVNTVSSEQLVGLFEQIFNIGWDGMAIGACGLSDPTYNGIPTFSMVCIGSDWQPNLTSMSLIREGLPSVQEFEMQIDFPTKMQTFEASFTPDEMADELSLFASQQASGGYHYMYPIIQTSSEESPGALMWDSKQIFTSSAGPYGGVSLYEVMKSLMAKYN